jgi:hypothetical protein
VFGRTYTFVGTSTGLVVVLQVPWNGDDDEQGATRSTTTGGDDVTMTNTIRLSTEAAITALSVVSLPDPGWSIDQASQAPVHGLLVAALADGSQQVWSVSCPTTNGGYDTELEMHLVAESTSGGNHTNDGMGPTATTTTDSSFPAVTLHALIDDVAASVAKDLSALVVIGGLANGAVRMWRIKANSLVPVVEYGAHAGWITAMDVYEPPAADRPVDASSQQKMLVIATSGEDGMMNCWKVSWTADLNMEVQFFNDNTTLFMMLFLTHFIVNIILL